MQGHNALNLSLALSPARIAFFFFFRLPPVPLPGQVSGPTARVNLFVMAQTRDALVPSSSFFSGLVSSRVDGGVFVKKDLQRSVLGKIWGDFVLRRWTELFF